MTPGMRRLVGMPGKGSMPDVRGQYAGLRSDTRSAGQLGDLWPSVGAPASDTLEGHATAETLQMMRRRAKTRRTVRDFLRAVPRSEPDATLALVRPDGSTRLLTRGELSAAIDRLRPRQRQIVRLAIEERWTRVHVCEYLQGISLKTVERDQGEALDLLASL
jgi:hypothetical protein